MKTKPACRRVLTGLAAAVAVVGVSTAAQAEPILQLYVEGGTYNTTTDTWDVTAVNNAATVWVVANTTSNEISKAAPDVVSNVNLVFSYDASNTGVTITGTPTEGSTGTFTYVASGTSDLPDPIQHNGETADDAWQQFALGNFTDTSDPLVNYDENYDPSQTTTKIGSDTRAYAIVLTNLTGTVHIDAFGTIYTKKNPTKLVAAPYSHDATITGLGGSVPELPTKGSAAGLALLLGGALLLGKRRRQDADV